MPGTWLTVLHTVSCLSFKDLCHGHYPQLKIRKPRFHKVIWCKDVDSKEQNQNVFPSLSGFTFYAFWPLLPNG